MTHSITDYSVFHLCDVEKAITVTLGLHSCSPLSVRGFQKLTFFHPRKWQLSVWNPQNSVRSININSSVSEDRGEECQEWSWGF